MRVGALGRVGGIMRRWSRPERRFQVLALVIGLGIAVTIWALRARLSGVEWEAAGYPGVFLLSFVGSASFVLPVPALISLCTLSVLLNPFALGLLSGVGETVGELSGYAVGYGGGSVIEKRQFYTRLQGWMERRGVLVLFAVSLIPNPFFDIVGIAAGSVRFSMRRFLATVLVGKVLKGLLVSYSCYFGVTLLPWFE